MESYQPEVVRVSTCIDDFLPEDVCVLPLEAFTGEKPLVKSFGLFVSVPDPEALAEQTTEEIIAYFKQLLKPIDLHKIDFLYLRLSMSLKLSRCAVIAITDVSTVNIMAELHACTDLRLACGASLEAATATLQSMGVGGFIISADEAELLENALEDIAPYLKASIGVNLPIEWLDNTDLTLWNVMCFVVEFDDYDAFREKALAFGGYVFLEKESGFIEAPDSQNCHYIQPTIDIVGEIPCTARFAEDILEAEDLGSGAVRVLIEDEDELVHLEELQYMLDRPVCFSTIDAALLEKTLRVFRGRGVYDGTFEISDTVLHYFSEKYGFILL